MTQVSMNHIPYKGAAPALTDVVAGQVALYIGSLPASMPHIKAGRVRALAVTGARRSPTLPDLQTVSEAGVAGFESIQWYGFMAPAGTPRSVLERLHRDLTAVLVQPAMKERLLPQGFELVASTREEFGKYIRAYQSNSWEVDTKHRLIFVTNRGFVSHDSQHSKYPARTRVRISEVQRNGAPKRTDRGGRYRIHRIPA